MPDLDRQFLMTREGECRRLHQDIVHGLDDLLVTRPETNEVLRVVENQIEITCRFGFIEVWSRTEFFQHLGEDTDFLYGLNPRPLSFITLFDLVMRRYAERRGATHWLQKCDPERALEVIPRLENPKVVIIKRDTIAVAESLRQMNRNRGLQFSLLKSIPGIVRTEKLLLLVAKRVRVV